MEKLRFKEFDSSDQGWFIYKGRKLLGILTSERIEIILKEDGNKN